MAGAPSSSSVNNSSSSLLSSLAPKILLAKPNLTTSTDPSLSSSSLRSRLPATISLNLLSGMLPPFVTQSEEIRAMSKHCSVGIELRVSSERLILLDTQPIFSPSVLAELMRPDGSSTITLTNGETLSADLAHEMMGIQFLCDAARNHSSLVFFWHPFVMFC
ncbi:hypothetical protein MKX01_009394 [Papaver californicum]|nr:hypothetical protein MKX01_009394 [Papaver californicum]